MKVRSVVPVLVILVCGCDQAPEGAATTAATTPAAPQGCAGLAAHWRKVWEAERKPGLERRAGRAAEHAVTAWTRGCAEVGATQPSPAEIEQLRGIKSFAALKAMDAGASKGALAVLVKTAQDAALKTEQAFAAAPASGVIECEDALADAAFCGDDVDKAAVKSAANGKDDGACTALEVLLAKKCAP